MQVLWLYFILDFGPDIVLIWGSASHISRWSLLLSASCWHLHFIKITIRSEHAIILKDILNLLREKCTDDDIKEKLFKPTGIHHTNVCLNSEQAPSSMTLTFSLDSTDLSCAAEEKLRPVRGPGSAQCVTVRREEQLSLVIRRPTVQCSTTRPMSLHCDCLYKCTAPQRPIQATHMTIFSLQHNRWFAII